MTRSCVFVAALAAAAGAVLGYHLGKGDAPRQEVAAPAPAVRQADGSLIAERRSSSSSEPAYRIPAGMVEERRVTATVTPDLDDCPPVTLDLSLVRDTAGGRRVIVDSPSGLVTSSVDTVVDPGQVPAPVRPWAVGIAYEPFADRYGAWVERDVSRFRLGADVKQGRDDRPEYWVRIGWRW